MEKFKISVVKRQEGYDIYTFRGREFLFRCVQGVSTWYFNVPENRERILWHEAEGVPVDFLLNLCKSVLMVRYGITDFEVEFTVEAKRLLKIK